MSLLPSLTYHCHRQVFPSASRQQQLSLCLKILQCLPLPLALMPILAKFFEKLVLQHLKNIRILLLISAQHATQSSAIKLTGKLNTTVLSAGAPQGCVLSPLMFTLYTHDFSPQILQWVIRTVQNIISTHLPSINDIGETDWRAVSYLRLWDCLIHPHPSTLLIGLFYTFIYLFNQFQSINQREN